ncbi:MAG TPA: IclR family transcriptional regulator [Chloroflexota bacterium]|nr:IclR family transcriptional regulator [Chloroflexota bacterium]
MIHYTNRYPDKLSGSLARGLRLLSVLGSCGPELGLSKWARAAGLDKATTYRLAQTLIQLGYVQRNHTSQTYRLGVRVLDLGFAYLASVNVREVALPYMQALAAELNETVSLSVLDGTDIVYLERFRPKRLHVSVEVHVGSRLPAHCTSMGKALLAALPPEEREQRLASLRLEPWTPRTITDRRVLASELDRVQHRGFAINDEETVLGLRSVAAVIRDRNGCGAAALNVAVSAAVFSVPDLEIRIAPRLVATVEQISAHLGWTPKEPMAATHSTGIEES